jgi:hypothetical protein
MDEAEHDVLAYQQLTTKVRGLSLASLPGRRPRTPFLFSKAIDAGPQLLEYHPMMFAKPTNQFHSNDNAGHDSDFALALASLADLLAEACIGELERAANDNRAPAAEA